MLAYTSVKTCLLRYPQFFPTRVTGCLDHFSVDSQRDVQVTFHPGFPSYDCLANFRLLRCGTGMCGETIDICSRLVRTSSETSATRWSHLSFLRF